MPRVKRRGSIVGAVACIAAVAIAGSAAAVPPDGPRLAFIRFGGKPVTSEVRSVDAAGRDTVMLAGGRPDGTPLPFPSSPLSWSADGSTVAYAGVTPHGGSYGRGASHDVFLVGADGGDTVRVPNTRGAEFPLLSPDGQSVAFLKVRGLERPLGTGGGVRLKDAESSVWLARLDGAGARRLTPWRRGRPLLVTAFSPDGSLLLGSRAAAHDKAELFTLSVSDGRRTALGLEGADPVFSPDGSRIAFLRVREVPHRHNSVGGRAHASLRIAADLYLANADGSAPVRLTHSGSIDEFPSWDPSASRLSFVRLARPLIDTALIGLGDRLMEINADGSCLTNVLSQPGVAYLGPAWQPGPGREAGPIVC